MGRADSACAELRLLPELSSCCVSVLGLGYVGLPLAIEISKNKECLYSKQRLNRTIIGYDISDKRVYELNNKSDVSGEVASNEFNNNNKIKFTNDVEDLKFVDVFVVCVPTPIDKDNKPYLKHLIDVSELIGSVIKHRKIKTKPIIIYESTVFPGATEEVCIPCIEAISGCKLNTDFFCGYSPERIVPGNNEVKLTDIKKVTSGSNSKVSIWIDSFYKSFISAGTYRATSIKVAEASKVIENTQRDLNIALVNELAIICNNIGIDTLDVIEAASTKWNFIKFTPGLVGGHCIGVDPYYLTDKAEKLGYFPEVILSARRRNNDMSSWIVKRIIEIVNERNISKKKLKALVLGFSFKENCSDIRNTKIIDLVDNLKLHFEEVDIVDPIVNLEACYETYGINILSNIPEKKYTTVILAVGHNYFLHLENYLLSKLLVNNGFFFDLKGILPRTLDIYRL